MWTYPPVLETEKIYPESPHTSWFMYQVSKFVIDGDFEPEFLNFEPEFLNSDVFAPFGCQDILTSVLSGAILLAWAPSVKVAAYTAPIPKAPSSSMLYTPAFNHKAQCLLRQIASRFIGCTQNKSPTILGLC